MAPIGTVFKNGIIFAVLSAPFIIGSAYLYTAFMERFWLYMQDGRPSDRIGEMIGIMTASLAALVIGVGIVYMKTLSDTVEDGMIEF